MRARRGVLAAEWYGALALKALLVCVFCVFCAANTRCIHW